MQWQLQLRRRLRLRNFDMSAGSTPPICLFEQPFQNLGNRWAVAFMNKCVISLSPDDFICFSYLETK